MISLALLALFSTTQAVPASTGRPHDTVLPHDPAFGHEVPGHESVPAPGAHEGGPTSNIFEGGAAVWAPWVPKPMPVSGEVGAPNFPTSTGSTPKLSLQIGDTFSIKETEYHVQSKYADFISRPVFLANYSMNQETQFVLLHTPVSSDQASIDAYKNEVAVLTKLQELVGSSDDELLSLQKYPAGIPTDFAVITNRNNETKIEEIRQAFLQGLLNFQNTTGFLHGNYHVNTTVYNETLAQVYSFDFSAASIPSDVKLLADEVASADQSFTDALKTLNDSPPPPPTTPM